MPSTSRSSGRATRCTTTATRTSCAWRPSASGSAWPAAGLAMVLFAQSLVGFDYIPFSQALLLGLGATGLRGERLRLLVLFALMPALGVGLHLLQNAWTLGLPASVADLAGAAAERSLARHFTVAALARHVLWDAGHYMG